MLKVSLEYYDLIDFYTLYFSTKVAPPYGVDMLMLSFETDCFIEVWILYFFTAPCAPPKVDSILIVSFENDFTDFIYF